MNATPGHDVLVDALCRRVEHLAGDAAELARAHAPSVAPLSSADDRERIVRAAVARLDGLGELELLLDDPSVDEVLVNGGGDVWVERDGVTTPVGRVGVDEVSVAVERILAPLGRRLDRTSPIVDARLPDGSRVCAVIPPIALDGTCVSIRRFRTRSLPLEAFGPAALAAVVRELLARRCNVIVSGATSSGKTSFLDTVLHLAGADERIVTIEDTAELRPVGAHLVRLEARPPSPDGPGPITLEQLVRTALRLRPDRLIVGEVRGPEVLGLVQALNTGHDGSWSTCHANSALDALHRLETLVVQAAPAWPLSAVRQQLTRSIDVVVHMARTGAAARRVVEIAEVVPGAELAVCSVVAGHEVVGVLTRGRV
jgi:pilus assembly protein CpaF